jgi:hypothetical protein
MIRFVAIRPPQFDDSAIRLAFLSEMRLFGEDVKRDYNSIGRMWHSSRPKFEIRLETRASEGIAVTVGTDNAVFGYLDKGVEGHLIIPRKGKVSGVAGTYIPGSMPGTLSVNPSGGQKVMDGNYLNLNQVIDWPGIEARGWSGLLAEKYSTGPSSLHARMQSAVNRAAEKVWRK